MSRTKGDKRLLCELCGRNPPGGVSKVTKRCAYCTAERERTARGRRVVFHNPRGSK